MSEVRTGTLPVPGATLFYKVLGSGPLLLLLPGGSGDAEAAFNGIAGHLADQFTLLTYDRRGLSRSRSRRGPCAVAHGAAGVLLSVASPGGPSTHEVPPGVYSMATQRLQEVQPDSRTAPLAKALTRSAW